MLGSLLRPHSLQEARREKERQAKLEKQWEEAYDLGQQHIQAPEKSKNIWIRLHKLAQKLYEPDVVANPKFILYVIGINYLITYQM